MQRRAAWIDEAFEIVRSIPPGRVMSYGDVGGLLKRPLSGLMIGRLMFSAPEGVPWWRVVGKDGGFPIARRGPSLAEEQRSRLKAERTPFVGQDKVDMAVARWHG